jgi:site-specific DNA recombinase
MIKREFFQQKFLEVGPDGFIGDPEGEPAYAYLRVSSRGQGEEGKDGIPRQIRNCHSIALEKGYKIPWDMVFCDDDTGFEFMDRPDYTRLRKEFKGASCRSNVIVMEYIERLSRGGRWHQGFLLDEMEKYRISPVFWKSYGSEIERAVMGAVGEDVMRHSLYRMHEATLSKARRGLITAKRPAYGYQFVDSEGNPGVKARKDTHYGIVEEEAQIIRYIFERIGYDCQSQRSLAMELNNRHISGPGGGRWTNATISRMIRNPVYKGEFVAHRYSIHKIWNPDDSSYDSVGKRKKETALYPEDDWIKVEFEGIVDTELWELANTVTRKNYEMSRRNSWEPFLLTGLIRCATCGHTCIGRRFMKYNDSYYGCETRHVAYDEETRQSCNQGKIRCMDLDDAVWSILVHVLLSPDTLLGVLDRQYRGEGNSEVLEQIQYIESQIAAKDREDQKLYRAYMADVFDEVEYSAKRQAILETKRMLEQDLARIKDAALTPEAYQQKRAAIIELCQRSRENGVAENAPFAVKQKTIKTVIDRIILDKTEGWFKLEGVVNGKFPLTLRNDLRTDSFIMLHITHFVL